MGQMWTASQSGTCAGADSSVSAERENGVPNRTEQISFNVGTCSFSVSCLSFDQGIG